MNTKRIKVAAVALAVSISCFSLPETVIGKEIFKSGISAKAENAEFTNIERDFRYRILDDDTVEIAGYVGESENPVIPSMIAGKIVTSIEG